MGKDAAGGRDFPLWTIVALALVLHDWEPRELSTLPRASRRGLLLFWSTALGEVIAGLLKIVLRRERPGLIAGWWGTSVH